MVGAKKTPVSRGQLHTKAPNTDAPTERLGRKVKDAKSMSHKELPSRRKCLRFSKTRECLSISRVRVLSLLAPARRNIRRAPEINTTSRRNSLARRQGTLISCFPAAAARCERDA